MRRSTVLCIVIGGIAAIILVSLVIGAYLKIEALGALPLNKSSVPSPVTGATGGYLRTWTWNYQGDEWKLSIEIPREVYDADRIKSHDRGNDYASYVFSDSDRPYIKEIVGFLREEGLIRGYSNHAIMMNAISFIQTLPSFPDNSTPGYDDYARFPVETLVDNGGDCEDTAILAAALLNEMGYKTAFILFPSHVALGLKANDIPGTYYEYENTRYYYLETTGAGYSIGQVPWQYQNMTAQIIPVARKPQVDLTMTVLTGLRDKDLTQVEVRGVITNSGTAPARNLTLTLAALSLDLGDSFIWTPPAILQLSDIPAETPGIPFHATLEIPRFSQSQIRAILEGENMETAVYYSERFTP